jgi:hypothetical protein
MEYALMRVYVMSSEISSSITLSKSLTFIIIFIINIHVIYFTPPIECSVYLLRYHIVKSLVY